jgi:hypothetical protein
MPEPITPTIRPVDSFRFCREEVKHEYNVLGSRLTSYITSQSFLFTTYAVSMSNPGPRISGPVFRLVFPLIVCAVGLLTSFRAQAGIVSCVRLINAWHDRQMELHDDPEVKALNPMDNVWMVEVHAQSLKFSTAAAYIFGISWLILLGLSVYLNSIK